MRKKALLAIGMAVLLALAGCSTFTDGPSDAKQNEKDLSDDTNVNVDNVETGGSYMFEIKVTEKNQMGLVRAQPPFVMERSLERANLIRRYEYLNDQNNVHHVYLMDEGQVVSYYVAQGKVSSVNSKLTNDKQVVRIPSCGWDTGRGAGGAEGSCFKVVESPQMDGSYGTNGEAIFFFTTDGKYIQSSLDYVVSEEPLNIQDEVILVDQQSNEAPGADAETNSTATNSTT